MSGHGLVMSNGDWLALAIIVAIVIAGWWCHTRAFGDFDDE